MGYKGAPKPFTYVDIVGNPPKAQYIRHDKFEKMNLTGSIELTFEVVSDFLFVGSGGYNYSEEKKLVYYSFFRNGGKIAIPGSSIKGAVRSVTEAISNSCLTVIDRKENYPRTHKKCEFEPDKKEKLCPSCSLFGTTGYSGRVSFSDSSPTKYDLELVKIFELFRPQTNLQKRKFYENKQFDPIGNMIPEKSHRFIEVVKKGSIFNTKLKFFNVTKEELSLLLYAIGINQDYWIKIGGAKPRCLGTVKFIPTKLLKLRENNPLEYEEKVQEDLKKFISEILSNDKLIEKNLLNQFKKGASWIREPCPKDVY